MIKASDFTDNGVGLIHTSGPKAVRLARKYAPLVPVLASLIARPDTPLPPPVKARILGQLVAAQERFAVIARAAGGAPLPRKDDARGRGSEQFPDWPYAGPDCLPRRTCGDVRYLL